MKLILFVLVLSVIRSKAKPQIVSEPGDASLGGGGFGLQGGIGGGIGGGSNGVGSPLGLVRQQPGNLNGGGFGVNPSSSLTQFGGGGSRPGFGFGGRLGSNTAGVNAQFGIGGSRPGIGFGGGFGGNAGSANGQFGMGGNRPGIGIGGGFGTNSAGVNGQSNPTDGSADQQTDGSADPSGGCSIEIENDEDSDMSTSEPSTEVSSAPICDGASEVYTYPINAILYMRGLQRSNESWPSYIHPYETQDFTFLQDIDDENPLNLRIWVGNEEANYTNTYWGNFLGTNACHDPNDCGWQSAAFKFVHNNVIPNATCPVEAGTYVISQTLDPFNVTFTEPLPSGSWTAYVNATNNDFELSLYYKFNLTDCDNC